MIAYRYFWPWSPYSRHQSRKRGRRDGKKGVPAKDGDQFPPYEMQVKNLGDENIGTIARHWEHQDRRLKADYCDAHSRVAAVAAEHHDAARALDAIQKKYDPARAEMDDCRGLIRVHPVFYWTLVLILVAGEFPLNAVVFKIFGEATLATYVFSTVIALGLPVCGHFLGLSLRKNSFARGLRSIDAILTLVLIFTPLLVITAIAYVREKYFEAPEVQSLAGVRMDPTMVTFVFIGINLMAFVLATVASYHAHHPEDVQKCIDNFRVRSKELLAAQRRLEKARCNQEKAEKWLNQAWTEREHAFRESKDEALQVKDFAQGLIDEYRDANLGGRSDGTLPGIWKLHPEIKFRPPLDSDNLDWNCAEMPGEEKQLEREPGAELDASANPKEGAADSTPKA